MSAVMRDLDRFKALNDIHGHACSDRVLTAVVDRIGRSLRETDSQFRWGGEEFLIVLPETSEEEAVGFAERTREATAAEPVSVGADLAIAVSASLGAATLIDPKSGPEPMIASADAALYRAKSEGRNRVVCG
jgi:diguanylate cyclase (GGDEF)-like protein